MNFKINYTYLLTFSIFLFFFLVSIIYYSYYFDPMHDGQVFFEAQKALKGYMPYKDFFISHGILAPYLNSIIVFFFNNSYSLSVFYNVIYLLSIFLLSEIIKKNHSEYERFFFTLIILLIHPFAFLPWNTYLIFFFISLGLFFHYFSFKKFYFLSGLCFGFCYLSSESFLYALFLIVVFKLLIIYLFFSKKNYKNVINEILFLVGITTPLLIFYFFIIYNNLMEYYNIHSKLNNVYIGAEFKDLILKIFFSFKLFIKQSILGFFISSHWFFLVIILFNILIFFIYLKNFNHKKNFFLFISFISVLMIYTIIYKGNIFRLSNGVIVGLVAIFFFIKNLKFYSNNKSFFFILILVPLSINFINIYEIKSLYNNINNKTLTSSNSIFFLEKKFLPEDISKIYFEIDSKSKKIYTNCLIRNSINLTNNAYISLLLNVNNLNLIQKSPLLRNDKREIEIEKYINNRINFIIKDFITNNKILIISDTKKIKDLILLSEINLNNYQGLQIQDSEYFIFLPNECILGML